ncbi:M23 family metallopeptidase [Myroides marinus]|jgi:murein DD-endopeptidase MepM/ murein hydrolase activator NlpD|uniref:M23 family metallopeptidase n=1 Tax=Myroides TaxID=76831 RepID=UPI0025772993|nr:M23 family metallopeptidase [Myroides marinus]MDR0196532.1 M23 family metallopeptidase [Myroides sp.]MDM1345411.1 M23 family metallopeptidase [Myroides marinus]MDM1349000.1 M23 family metallopeptidase [Myroides marinus]MDM1352639.1 M23 family metallopeptidase [Myroides marinus]MDM1356210.1 M23 family metallopeptidase [Myroides marinus]
MAKVKYYYDPEKLAFLKIRPKKFRQIGNILLFLLTAAIFGVMGLFFLINSDILQTPKEKKQAREIAEFKTNYTLLNKKLDLITEVLDELEVRDNDIYRAYFNTAPIPDEQRKSGLGGINRYRAFVGLNNERLLTETNVKMDQLLKQVAIQSQSLDDIIALAKKKEEFLSSIPAIQPVKNEDLKRMASGYGYRSDPFTKIKKFHSGMDFSAEVGTPVYATGNGKVIRANNELSGYGNLIEVDHGYGYLTRYAHLSKYQARAGQAVKRGDIIGYVGSTGRSSGPHLHYEVHYQGNVVNPLNYYYGEISAKEFELLSQEANQENQSLD